jgi:hypothetical protein
MVEDAFREAQTQASTRALIYPELETDMMVENADIE